jgi:hypothetical protein
MSNLAETIFPPENDVFAASKPGFAADLFAPKPAEASPIAEKPAQTVGEMRDLQAKQEAAKAPVEPEHQLTAAEQLFGSETVTEAYSKLGVNPEGMALDNPSQVSIDMPPDWLSEGTPEMIEEAKMGFHAADMPQEMISDFTHVFMHHAVTPVTTTIEQSNAELRQIYGDKAPEKIALAQKLVAKAAVKWPGIKDYLERYGTGNDTGVILKVIARAEYLQKQGKL